ncbi:ATP-binding cassette domain-containing protein [Flavobacterium sp. XN-5]|uniref:ABC transporter ATP-binding protein n=1 Tax=Flavobacterium sp. XN-5 TaxID=2599390 RepID=UPI0011C81A4C|nr:ABC transporter ATP-binding protein [Flavobacterium sp. XN-5]NGY37440.1 ATP-binding cassette domain-containing protein [Flavobacterium sp. XN-5]
MKDIILKAENISKQYRLGQVGTGTLSHDLNRWWHQVRGKENPYLKIGDTNDRSTKGESDYVWALQDINFEVERGEVLGIIGKNGAGKSTLLKILSRVTAPTTGTIKFGGRVASLLEVGTGFNGEMTGRENIYLNGAILGMTKKEIASKIDEIIDFSGCERYIDTPVKRYSSGMTVRLAFAVAAFLEPEILIIDEVLAVGDAEFQKKAIGKMQDISRSGGRTVLFVSHNMAAVQSLCTRGIVLENGRIVFDGVIEEAINRYMLLDETDESYPKTFDKDSSVFGNSIVRLNSVDIISTLKENFFTIKEKLNIRIDFSTFKDIENFNLAINFKSFTDDVIIFSQITPVKFSEKGGYVSELVIPENFLNSKMYTIDLHFVCNNTSLLTINNVVNFEMVDFRDGINYYGVWAGYVRPNLKFDFDRKLNN